MTNTKFCSSCNESKAFSHFSRRPGARDGYRSQCKKCMARASAARYAKHPERAANYYLLNKQRIHAYRDANAEKLAASGRQYNRRKPGRSTRWARANPERAKANKARYRSKADARAKERAYKRSWTRANPDNVSATAKRVRQKHKEKIAAKNREWRKLNAEHVRTKNRNRKHQVRGAGSHTKAEVDHHFRRQKGRCISCSASLTSGYHVDHIQPIARCGSNTWHNLQLLCPACNMQKGAKDPIEFMRSKGFLL